MNEREDTSEVPDGSGPPSEGESAALLDSEAVAVHDESLRESTAVVPGDDAAPQTEQATRSPAAADRQATPIPRGWALALQIVLPIALGAAAVGVHWWIDVPEVVAHSTRDQGAPKPEPERAPRSRPRAEREPRGVRPRSQATLARHYERYAAAPFSDEPTNSDWAREFQTIVARAVVVARQDAFDGAPEQPHVTLSSNECRTVRCRFVLRSPYPAELDAIRVSLQQLRGAGGPLWRSYEAVSIDPPEGSPENNRYLQVTVAFSTDDVDKADLAAGGEDPDVLGAPAPADPADPEEIGGAEPDADEPE